MTTLVSQRAAGIFSLSILCAATSLAHGAQSSVQPDRATLPTTTVTASLNQMALSDAVGDVLVIAEPELAAHQGQTVLEVLEGQPSIRISRSGGLGTVSGVSLRGNNNQHTLVLIDGVRYGSVSVGGSALGLIAASQVERIEVLYGSSATSLYGSDAIGGVVQVFTKKGDYNTKTQASLSVGGGSYDSRTLAAQLSAGSDKARFTLGASHDSTGGVSAIAKADPSNRYDSYESDKDSFTNKSLSASAGVKLGAYTELAVSALYGSSNTEFDAGSPAAHVRSKQNTAAGNVSLTTAIDNLSVDASLGTSLDDVETPFYTSRFTTRQTQAKLLGSLDTSLGVVSLGAEQLKQSLDASTKLTQTERSILSGVFGYQLAAQRWDAQLSARVDDIENYDNEATYSAGLAYVPTKGVRLGGSYATGFRLPTFNDLYYPFEDYGSSSYQGNPDLKPERSRNAEIFVELTGAAFTTRLTGFDNAVDDLIVFGALPSGTGTMVNVNQAHIQGVSLKSEWQGNSVFAGYHYDYLDAKDDKTNKQLTYRAHHAGGVYAGVRSSDYRLKAEVQYTGKRYSDAANTDALDPYTLVNLSANMSLSPLVDVGVSVNNLLDERYTLIKNYSTLGTHALATVTVHTP